jgi:hypothetical protein
LIYNGNDTLANGLVISPDSAYLGYAYPFSYYYTDNNGCSNTASEYVLFEQCTDTVLAVKNIAGNAVSLTFYPNPASDLINVKADGLTSGSYTLSLNNTDGQVVSIQRINVTGNILDTRMNMQNISAGIYFLSLSSETVRETIKVVKY